jgi:hypothetical protein
MREAYGAHKSLAEVIRAVVIVSLPLSWSVCGGRQRG